jgi:hypothetical protein
MRRTSVTVSCLVLLGVAAQACGETAGPLQVQVSESDASAVSDANRDAPKVDAGPTDAALNDASIVDANRPDVAVIDSGSDASVDAGVPEVRYVGRFDESDPAGPRASWPAARAIVRFRGTALEAALKQEPGPSPGSAYLDVLVDGNVQGAPIEVTAITQTVSVASGLPLATHTIELVKRTEPLHGIVQFRGFSYPGGGSLLPPSPAPLRRIEVIGNSAISGYGIEGAGPSCPGGAPSSTFNARKSAASIVADRVGADLTLLGYNGKGYVQNFSASDTVTFPLLFPRTLPTDATSIWNFARAVPDAFVLIAANSDAEVSDTLLTSGYASFVATVRSKYPAAHIFLVVSSYASDDYPAGLMTRTRLLASSNQVVTQRAAAGDTKVYAYGMVPYLEPQLTGCYAHPGAALHVQMANELEPWIRTRLGW